MSKEGLDFKEAEKVLFEVKNAFEEYKASNDQRIADAVKGAVDPLLEEKLARIDADLLDKQEKLDQLYVQSRRKSITLDGKAVDIDELDAKAQEWAKLTAHHANRPAPADYGYDNLKEYKAAFARYLRKDDRVLTPDEQKALSVGSDPDGGYVVDPDTSGRIVRKQYETSPMRQYASIQVITTSALEGLHDLDEAASGWVGERQARPETSTPQLKMWSIPVHEQYAEPQATQKLVDDAGIDMAGWLADMVADKLVRTENTAFVAGDGDMKPRGFTTYPAGSTNPGQIVEYNTGVSGGFAAAPNGGDVLIDMIQGLKSNYRSNANFFMGRLTVAGVRKLKDSDGAYLWQPGIAVGAPSTLLGYGIAEFEDMATYTTPDARAIAFGDMAQAYQIVERMGIRVLIDPYTNKPFIKYYTTKRVGGDVVNFEAINLLRFGT